MSLFYLDESGFSNIPNVQRAWSPKGKPHCADASSGRQRVNVIGALEFSTGRLWYDLNNQSIKRAHVTNLIDRIAQREQRMPLTVVLAIAARDQKMTECRSRMIFYRWKAGRLPTLCGQSPSAGARQTGITPLYSGLCA